MRLFVFNVWGGEIEENELQQIFVAGCNLKDAEDKLLNRSNIEFEDYELDSEVYYDEIIF